MGRVRGAGEGTSALDSPAWHALCGAQVGLGTRFGRAARFDPEISPFGGFRGVPGRSEWEDMVRLTGPAGRVAIVGDCGKPPPGWEVVWSIEVAQMLGPLAEEAVGRDLRALADSGEATAEPVPLGVADVEGMLELARLTRPGPFFSRAIEFGGYVGIRRAGRLVAMAGERMRPPGYAEISAVATHPDVRGNGLGCLLVRAMAARISRRGERPFLHVALENERAYRLYAWLGFTTRRQLTIHLIGGPESNALLEHPSGAVRRPA